MNVIFRILAVIVLIADLLLKPIFFLLSLRKPKKIPPIDNSVLLLSATELAQKIREKKISSEFIITTYIERIKLVNPIINAVAENRFTRAISEAKYVDLCIKNSTFTIEKLKSEKPFFGVPITIKESLGLKGLTQAVGSLGRKDTKCSLEGVSVTRLKDAGFIPLLVSTCPEYCVGLETINLITGVTKNPYDTNKSTGGSSGGEAALLSSAASVVGIGSDFAGSIRLPCMFTGIFGHKATPKVILRRGHFPDHPSDTSYDYFSIGPMARYSEDLKPMLKIISGEEGLRLNLDRTINICDLKVFYTESDYNILGIQPVQSEIRLGIKEAVEHLRTKFGISGEKLRFPEMHDAMEMGTSLYFNLGHCPNFLEDPQNPKENLNLYFEIIKSICGKSLLSFHILAFCFIHRYNGFVPVSDFPYYYNEMKELKVKFAKTLGDNGVFLYPSFPTSAYQHYQVFTKTLGVCYSMLFNLLGCPSTQVPIGLDKNNMPIGIQVIAAPHNDGLCLAVAKELEIFFGGWTPPYETN